MRFKFTTKFTDQVWGTKRVHEQVYEVEESRRWGEEFVEAFKVQSRHALVAVRHVPDRDHAQVGYGFEQFTVGVLPKHAAESCFRELQFVVGGDFCPQRQTSGEADVCGDGRALGEGDVC